MTIGALAEARDQAVHVQCFFRQLWDELLTWTELAKAKKEIRVEFTENKGLAVLRIGPRDEASITWDLRKYRFQAEMCDMGQQMLALMKSYNQSLTDEISDALLLGAEVVPVVDPVYELQSAHTHHALISEILILNVFYWSHAFIDSTCAAAGGPFSCRLLNAAEIVPLAAIQLEFAAAVRRLERIQATAVHFDPSSDLNEPLLSPRAALLDERDRDLYDRRMEGASWSALVKLSESYPDAILKSNSGAKAAVHRYAKEHGLPPPPPDARGRRPKKTNN